MAGGPVKEQKGQKAAGPERGREEKQEEKQEEQSDGGHDGEYIVGEDNKGDAGGKHLAEEGRHGGAAGAYAPKGTAAPAGAKAGPLAKNGKALTLRFVLPSGPGSDTLNTVATRISAMLDRLGIVTTITKVSDESYFKDHIAAGDFDLALYSWPSSAFPATDARPIYAKPLPGADGSVNVEQNYTRVGTDQVDQLFEQAATTLDEDEAKSLIRQADSRIWAAAGSIPLYQRPQLVGARKDLVNAGAFGFQDTGVRGHGIPEEGG